MSQQQGQQSNDSNDNDTGYLRPPTKAEERFYVLFRFSATLINGMKKMSIDVGSLPGIYYGDPITATVLLKHCLSRTMAVDFGGPNAPRTIAGIESILNDFRSELLILKSDEPTTTTVASLAEQNSAIYKRLERNEDIRLINLLPASKWDDPLACNIVPASFADGPEFEALSYPWGLQNGVHGSIVAINCAHSTLQISSNLNSALRDLRSDMSADDSYRVLWVDAICIDQSHSEEKAHQIRQMKRIYSEAKRVIVWLGQGTEKGVKAFKTLESISELGNPFSNGSDISLPYLEPLNSIGESPWWTRAWCRQEIIMAKEASMYLGSASLDWRDLSTAFRAWTSLLERIISPLETFHEAIGKQLTKNFFHQLAIIEQWRGSLGLPTLLEVLLHHGDLQVTDPRDSVYALLGLVNSRDPCHADITLQPDYTIRLSDLFIRVAMHLFKHHGLDILSFATPGLSPSRIGLLSYVEYLPTWAPDWRQVTFVEGSHFAFTNFFRSVDPSQRLLAELSRAWNEKCGIDTDNRPVASQSRSSDGIVLESGHDMIVSLEHFRPISSSLFSASEGLETERYRIVDTHQGEKMARMCLICSGFTVDRIESLGAETGSITDKLKQFPSDCGFDWYDNRAYPHIQNQSRFEAVIRSAIADQWPIPNNPNSGYHRLGDSLAREMADFRLFLEKINKSSVARFAKQRRLFRSYTGYIGLAPPEAKKDDVIVILSGATVPFVLRSLDKAGLYEFIGDW
jgi:hypothetical protein